MPKFLVNFFSKILSHKKSALFLLLALTIIYFAIPQPAFAWSWPWDWATDEISAGLLNVLIGLVFAIPLAVVTLAATISKLLFGIVETLAISGAKYTTSDAVQLGWPIVRDLANMMIVLGSIVIGISTALRFRDYEAKKLLFPLIIAALLVNFSKVICEVFIDGSNIIIKYFFDKASNGGGGWITPSADLFALIGTIGTKDPVNFVPIVLSMTFFYFIEFFTDLLYACLLLFRMIAMQILLILSPLAFVCYVFPATKNIWNMWWKNFFQWCIIAIPAGLFYFIGESMISKNASQPTADFGAIVDAGIKAYLTSTAGTILIPGIFLIAGFLFSLQFSAMGAGAIMSFANKNKGKILGGGFGALAKASGGGAELANKLANSNALKSSSNFNLLNLAKKPARGLLKSARAGGNFVKDYRASSQKTKATINQGLEAIGAIEAGSGIYAKSKDLKENQGRMTSLISQGKLQEVLDISEGKGTGRNPKERAAAIGALLKSKNFNYDNEKHINGLTDFQNEGGDLSEYAEKDSRLAGHNISAIKNTLAKENTAAGRAARVARGGPNRDITEDEAATMVREKAAIKELTNVKMEDINIDLLTRVPGKAMSKGSDNFSEKKVNGFKEFITAGTRAEKAVTTKLNELRTALAAPGITPAETASINEKMDNITDNIAEIRSW
jgi:hypothetical protein